MFAMLRHNTAATLGLLSFVAGAALGVAACGGTTKPNVGMVEGANAFPVLVTDLGTTPKFAWDGGPAKSLIVTNAMAHETAEQLAKQPVVWDAYSSAGLTSPVTLNTLPDGATSKTGSIGGLRGGGYFVVYIQLVNGTRGSYKFQVPMPTVGKPGELPATACTPTSTPSGHYGHCVSPYADKGNLCSEFTGNGGAASGKQTCVAMKGTYGDGPCPTPTAGQCLSRCGAPNESLDTSYFATPDQWQAACAARHGTYVAPAAPAAP